MEGEPEEGWPGARLPCFQPAGQRVEEDSGSFLEGQRGRAGKQGSPTEHSTHCQARLALPAPHGSLPRGRQRPGAGLSVTTSQTEILHFQAVKNVKFPCSGLESHRRHVGTLVTVADQTSDGSWGCL